MNSVTLGTTLERPTHDRVEAVAHDVRPPEPSPQCGSDEILPWLTATRFGLILTAFSFAMFSDVWFGAKTFFIRDFGIFSYPLAHYFRESFWRGEIPLWNPLNNCGIPFLAQWNTMVCYPLSIFYLVLPLSWALGVFCLLHQILGGVGMFALAHRWTNHRLAAGIAGIAFAFNGMTLNCLIWPHITAALSWMPWAILLLEKSHELGGRHLLAAAAVGALQMLAGGPEVVFLTWAIAGGLLGVDVATVPTNRTKKLFRFAGVAVLVVGLSAVQLAPFLDLLMHSQRNANYASAASSLPALGWANFLVPLFHCFRSPLGVYFQPEQFWTSSYYVGIGIVALALPAVVVLRDWRVRFLALASTLALLLALGDHTPIYGVLKKFLPAMGFMNYPVKFVLLPVFCLPLLAAMTATQFLSKHSTELSKTFRLQLLVWLALSLAIVGIVELTRRSPVSSNEWAVVWRDGATRAFYLTATMALLLALTRNFSRRVRAAMGLLLLATSWLDLATHAPSQNPTLPRAAYETGLTPAMDSKPKPRAGESRAALSRTAQAQFEKCLVADPLQSYLGTRLALFSDCNLLEAIPKLDGFFPLYLREERDVVLRFAASSSDTAAHWLDFVGTSQIIPEGKLFDWTARDTALPLISAGQRPVFVDDSTALNNVLSANFDSRREVLLPLEARAALGNLNTTSAQIFSPKFTAHQVEAEVESPTSTLVVIAQTYYHPWRASVDHQPAKLWRANHAYQAVEVPAGRHRLKLVYADQAFDWGALVSALTFAGITFAWFWKRGGTTTEPASLISSPVLV